jgi:hypothetical protein
MFNDLYNNRKIIIIVLIIILIIYLLYKYPYLTTKEYWRTAMNTSHSLYKKTNGYLDEYAKNTLIKINQRAIPTPEDYLISALILDRNVIQNEQMINRENILNAGNNYIDAINHNAIFDANDNGNIIIDFAFGFGETWDELLTPLTNYATTKKTELIKDRVDKVKKITDNKKEATELYLTVSTTHTNDGQNVHDSNINHKVKAIVSKLIEEAPDTNYNIDNIIDYFIKSNFANNNKFESFMTVIDVFKKSEYVLLAGVSDLQVLEIIWNRINDERNSENKDKLLEALYNNILDCYENDNIVCANGRILRVIGALTLLDFDESNWYLFKTEDTRNMVFDEVRKLIDKIANDNAEGNLKYACIEYGATSNEENARKPTEEETKELEDIMKKAIANMIDELAVKYDIKQSQIPLLKEEALASII